MVTQLNTKILYCTKILLLKKWRVWLNTQALMPATKYKGCVFSPYLILFIIIIIIMIITWLIAFHNVFQNIFGLIWVTQNLRNFNLNYYLLYDI